MARGNIRSLQMEVTGTSKAYVKGSLRSVFAHVSGVSEVHVDGSSGAPGPVLHSLPSVQAHRRTLAYTVRGVLNLQAAIQAATCLAPSKQCQFGFLCKGMPAPCFCAQVSGQPGQQQTLVIDSDTYQHAALKHV